MTQLELGLLEKRKGKERAATHNQAALKLARIIARDYALINGTVNADDVRFILDRRYPNTYLGNASGSIFNDGNFEPCGFVPSLRQSRHGAIIRQWRLRCQR